MRLKQWFDPKHLRISHYTVAAIALGGSLFAPGPEARGHDDRTDGHPPAQLALAQICASEASVQVETDDCAAIAHVLKRRARRMSFTAMALKYSTRVFQRDRRDARRWIAHLKPDGARPTGWPEALPWSKWQPRWLSLYRHAGRILRNEVPSPCATPPDHWGGSMDDWRAIKAGWQRVDCGQTLNHFWAVPGGTG
jgi:hypothetical protein